MALEAVELGLVGDVADRAGLGTAAEQRALRAFEHFDALEVGGIDVEVARRELQRLVVEIQRDVGEVADRRARLAAGEPGAETADEDRALARAVVPEGDVGRVLDQVVERRDVELRQRLAGEGLDRQRHLLDAFVAALRGDGDLADAEVGRIGRGGSVGRGRGRNRGGEGRRPAQQGRDGARQQMLGFHDWSPD